MAPPRTKIAALLIGYVRHVRALFAPSPRRAWRRQSGQLIPARALMRAAAHVLCSAGLLLGCVEVTKEREQAPRAAPPASPGAAPLAAEAHPASAGAAPHAPGEGPGAPAQAASPPDLGLRFADPPWFRESMFPGAEVVDDARSLADAHGRFKSHLVFALPQGSTVPACLERARVLIEPHVPALQSSALENDRERLTGSNARYEVSVICGTSSDGRVRAYVGFEWKS